MARKKSRKELMLAKRFAVNQQVKAKYKRSHLYYAGKIVAVRTNGSYAVSFDDGDFDQNVPHKNIKALADESSSPSPVPPKSKSKTPPKQPSKQATPTKKSRRSLSVNNNESSPPPATADGDDSASTSSMDSSQSDPPTVWSDEHDAVDRCVPPLTSSSHKGSSGRIGVLGGSDVYTGAPYYAATASLKVGADLATVMCAKEAAVAIKSYSPELMVAPVYSVELFDEAMKKDGEEGQKEQSRLVDDMVSSVSCLLDKFHVLVIGPGLGRHPLVMSATAAIIKKAKNKKLALVLDADALYLLTRPDHKDLLTDYDKVVLTPNAPEYRNLTELDDKDEEMVDVKSDSKEAKDKAKNNDKAKSKQDSKLTPFESRMNKAIIVQKGHHDHISSILTKSPPIRRRMTCEEDGGPKRSGGLGDILSGSIATFLAWNLILEDTEETDERRKKEDPPENQEDRLDAKLLACWSACCVVKRSTRASWRRAKRGMTASDVLEEIPEMMDLMLKGR